MRRPGPTSDGRKRRNNAVPFPAAGINHLTADMEPEQVGDLGDC